MSLSVVWVYWCSGTAVEFLCLENYCWIRMLLKETEEFISFVRGTRQSSYSFFLISDGNICIFKCEKDKYRKGLLEQVSGLKELYCGSLWLHSMQMKLSYHNECSVVINKINLSHQSVLYVCLHICIFLPEWFQLFWKSARC